MPTRHVLLHILIFFGFLTSCALRPGKPRILIFSKTTGFRHSSIPQGQQALLNLARERGYLADTTEDAAYFNEDSLKNYSAVVFLHTTGDLLNARQEADFERYIQAGGGFMGIHAAADAEYDWGWYGRLIGGYFESHPEQQEALLQVVDSTDESTRHLPRPWKRKDEWYNFKKINPEVHVLLKIDESSYSGGKNGERHPMAWYHAFDGGRAWYTELGHTEASFSEDPYLKHLTGGLAYAIGKNKKLNYGKAKTLRVPDEDRFTKVQLTQGTLYEPTEMTVLPNLDVLIVQRRGEFMLYKNSTQTVRQVGFLDVYYKTKKGGVNAEEGLLGIQADPDFTNNHFVYVFYSPSDTSVNRLSRFKFENDTLDNQSEKVVLEFYSQREICCHTGGSVAFGQGRELFVSTGDNTTPFDQPTPFANHGFGPMDGRPGFEQYDARRSSGNTNDLRGKILRILINPDGSYRIPEGNLFPPGMAGTRPEIYVMGNRNPYRISVDKRRRYLYWGEVGPDSGTDSLDTRGPRGYDELNQAKKAGFFGWPMFVGNNYPYHEYDYATGRSGAVYNPEKPVNRSPNNTGLQELPPVSPAFIWYPYAVSPDFPQMGTGGRNAMAGPTYYTDDYPAATRLPDYFNGRVFIYEWMRNFIRLVTLDENGDFFKMEPFMPSTKLAAVIDMETGSDGRLYLLEYGNGWFSKNPDAGLSRIDYNAGNRNPVISDFSANKLSGKLPFTLTARITARDPENEPLTYTWHLGNGEKKITREPQLEYTYTRAGDYAIHVEVADAGRLITRSKDLTLYAGNEMPEVQIAIRGNQTFYFPGKPVNYEVSVSDADDPEAALNRNTILVNADYMEGTDKAASGMGHQLVSAAMVGKNTMLALDCKNCHLTDQKSIGPSFTAVALRYKNDPKAADYLTDKIIRGGSGVWGETAMAAHPNLDRDEARLIVNWIQSLSSAQHTKTYPASGSLPATLGNPVKDKGVLTIHASYTDRGAPGIKPLTGTTFKVLRNNTLDFSGVTALKDFSAVDYNGLHLLLLPGQSGWFSVDDIDLTAVKAVRITAGWQQAPVNGYDLEIRLDDANGPLLGKASITASAGVPAKSKQSVVTCALKPVRDGKLHRLFITSSVRNGQEPNRAVLKSLQFESE